MQDFWGNSYSARDRDYVNVSPLPLTPSNPKTQIFQADKSATTG
ncbi:MAG: hypothetical protein PHR06_07405 [Candidatus Cloacimonetes bacterium]|nr:hypothetical protein [Candidatus Cloacimonadota bacterium]